MCDAVSASIRNRRLLGSFVVGFHGNVVIRGDRIVTVGRAPKAQARREIDVRGLVVAPGFIDIHSHSDWLLFEDGDAQSKIHQGVTMEILGGTKWRQSPISPDSNANSAVISAKEATMKVYASEEKTVTVSHFPHFPRKQPRTTELTVRRPQSSRRLLAGCGGLQSQKPIPHRKISVRALDFKGHICVVRF